MEKVPRVLYVGNDRELAEQLQSILVDIPCQLQAVAKFQQINQCIAALPTTNDPTIVATSISERFAAILLDVELPAEDAAALLRQIKEYNNSIPVIMLSSRLSFVAVSLARLDGAQAYFFKPLREIEPLIETVRHSIEKLSHWEACIQRVTESGPS